MKHITVGVAGHIDHGKTALVRALTGTETDRLAEEQQRGMSIVLGFAHLALPEGEIDLIDVPGHEKFVKTMIAGATGIEAVLLVVAANELIKPQTVEHLALTGLLGVEKGLVVVTKSDLVPDPVEKESAAEQIREFLSETFLNSAPIVFASSVTGEGLDELRVKLSGLLAQAATAPRSEDFALPVDRVFSISGHGTVVTGTLRRGALRLGQTVQLLPGGARAEVRGLEVHGQPVPEAMPGGRMAVNLRGVKKEDVERGGVLASPDFLRASRLLDTELRLLPTASKPLKRGQRVRVHYGTSEAVARVFPLVGDEVLPGETAFVQLRLDDEVYTPVRERFVLRILSPAETVGGGVVLDAAPAKHRRDDMASQTRLMALAQGDVAGMLRESLRAAGPHGLDTVRFARDHGLDSATLSDELTAQDAVCCAGGLALLPDYQEDLICRALETVSRFHARQPTLPGMPREELRQKLATDLPSVVFTRVLEELIARDQMETEDALVREHGFSSADRLSPLEKAIAAEIEDGFRKGGLHPPNLSDILGTDRRKKNLYHFLVRTGVLVAAVDKTNNRTVVFHRDTVADAERVLADRLSPTEGQSVSELNAMLDTSRKNSIPLLELLDVRGVTRRVGDLRVFVPQSERR